MASIFKIIKNNSGSIKTWGGKTLNPGEYYTLPEVYWSLWVLDVSIIEDIVSGDMVINDGVEDLDPEKGLVWFKMFERSIAEETEFNNDSNGFTSNNVQSAIEEANGVIKNHGSRHLPNGADPINTAAPSSNLTANTSNSAGNANSLARSDHSHDISTGSAVQLSASSTSTEGTSANLSRADHTHNILSSSAIGLNANSVNAEGDSLGFARANHTHAMNTSSAVGISTATTSTEGNSTGLARANHTHAVEIINDTISSNTTTTTTSGSDVLISGMTFTPEAGRYFIIFSTHCSTNFNNATVTFSLYMGGSMINGSERAVIPRTGVLTSFSDGRMVVVCHSLISVNGSQAIQARWRRSSGTATSYNRTLQIIKVN